MEETNTNKGIGSSAVLIVLALIVLGVGIYYVVTQLGGAQVSQPSPTQYTPSQYAVPTGTPLSGPEIQSVSDLDNTNKTLNSLDPDTSMNADLNGLSADSSGL